MPGWIEEPPTGKMRTWTSPHGSVLSVDDFGSGDWLYASESELQEAVCRLAASRAGGLIEVRRVPCGERSAVRLIYKRLQNTAYVFTGMFIASMGGATLIWTIVDGERGVTGVREAIVGAEMWNSGTMKTIEDFERLWPQDPYDMLSFGADRSVRRFISDSEEYDPRFPDHPLTRVRRFLDELCDWIAANQDTPSTESTVQ